MNDPFTIRIAKDLRKQVEQEAKNEHRSISQQIVKILTDYFKKER